MSEERTVTPDGQEANGGQGQATQEHTEERAQAGQGKEGQAAQEKDSAAYDREYVGKVIEESKQYRNRAQKAEKEAKRLREAQDAGMQELATENENLKTENERLKGRIRRSAFIESVGLPNARAAWGYVLDGTVEVEWDEDNRPRKLDEIRKTLREEDPALFGDGSADGAATSRTAAGYRGAPGLGRLHYAYEQKAKG